MPATKEPIADGMGRVVIDSWAEFHTVIQSDVPDIKHFVWRGQRSSDWLLTPSLDRLLSPLTAGERAARREEHLDAFRFAVRGRRGPHPQHLASENDWWALGQHYGLATPLLDWTKSPFAAAFFAFVEEKNETTHRAVYGINRVQAELASARLREDDPDGTLLNYLDFVSPLSDENPRLVSQGGLFTRAPADVPINNWVEAVFAARTTPVLITILVPEGERLACLCDLNRMNINHLSLFPDVAGASSFCNLSLQVEDY